MTMILPLVKDRPATQNIFEFVTYTLKKSVLRMYVNYFKNGPDALDVVSDPDYVFIDTKVSTIEIYNFYDDTCSSQSCNQYIGEILH